MGIEICYNPDSRECAGCQWYMKPVRRRRMHTAVLDLPGNPTITYFRCWNCSYCARTKKWHQRYLDQLNANLIRRAKELLNLGTFGPDAQAEAFPEAQVGGAP
jgi:hypothetical protein